MGKFSVLEQSKLTSAWSLEERSALAHFMERQSLKKAEYLFFEKSSERQLYFIDEGELQVEACGTKITLGPGSSVGEISLFRETKKRVSASALSNCKFWVITQDSWKRFSSQAPELAQKFELAVFDKLADLIDLGSVPPKVASLFQAEA